MHLRTLADTTAILAWHGTPSVPASEDALDSALRLYVVNARLLQDAWAGTLLRTVMPGQIRSRIHLAEEILTCELLSCSVSGFLQAAGLVLARQQNIAAHVQQTMRVHRERAVQQVTGHAEILSESLRVERLQRRLLQWGERMQPAQCASHTGLDALWNSSAATQSRSRHTRSWNTLALSLAIPNRTCSDALRAGLMQELCGAALALLPASSYQPHGPLKPHSQRLAERHGDMSLPAMACESKRW